MSSSPPAFDDTAGSDSTDPARPFQSLQAPLAKTFWWRKSLPPPTNTSIRPGPHDTAAGAVVRPQPSDSHPKAHQPLKAVESQAVCWRSLLEPSANTSSRFGPQKATVGE